MATSASAGLPSGGGGGGGGGVVSPPDATSPSSNPSAAPSATIAPTGPTTFQHKPLTAAPVRAFLDTTMPALNTTPLELDSTPVSSPVSRQGTWENQLPGMAAANSASKAGDADAKGGGGGSSSEKARLRADDPAVMPAPPGTPGAEDFEAATTDAQAQS